MTDLGSLSCLDCLSPLHSIKVVCWFCSQVQRPLLASKVTLHLGNGCQQRLVRLSDPGSRQLFVCLAEVNQMLPQGLRATARDLRQLESPLLQHRKRVCLSADASELTTLRQLQAVHGHTSKALLCSLGCLLAWLKQQQGYSARDSKLWQAWLVKLPHAVSAEESGAEVEVSDDLAQLTEPAFSCRWCGGPSLIKASCLLREP